MPDICDIFDIQVTPERRAQLAGMDLDGLRRFRAMLKTQRQWPER